MRIKDKSEIIESDLTYNTTEKPKIIEPSRRNCANNIAVKYIKNFSKIIKICLTNDWLDKNSFTYYKSKVNEVKRVYLSEEEISKHNQQRFQNRTIIS